MTILGLVVMTGIGALLYWRGRLRGELFVIYAFLAMPLWWTGDKILQTIATNRQEAIAFANIHDERFIAELFDLPLPLSYSNSYYFQGDSLTDNEYIDYLNIWGGRPRHGFEVILEIGAERRKHPEKSLWYSYRVEMCGDAVCPYDPALARPISPRDREVLKGELLSKTEETLQLWYPVMTQYQVSLGADRTVSHLSTTTLNSARNPFDRGLRQLFQRDAPDYWYGTWGYSISFVTGQFGEH